MELTPAQRRFVERARVGRLATTDNEGYPHVVPICYVLLEDTIGHSLDEKPKTVGTSKLRRVKNIRRNPRVGLGVDRYREDWSRLGWVQLRGTATITAPDHPEHERFVRALRSKYRQYKSHALSERLLIRIRVEQARSWGHLETFPHPPDYDG